MIYEIQIRSQANNKNTSDQLIWIDSDLPTRSFEQWLMERSLLNRSGIAPVVRWSIVQTQRAAHFVLATQAKALENRIAELINGVGEVLAVPDASKALKAFQLKAVAKELAEA
ncbi:hypothetical protein [Undibacterium terreum]|uniref:Uncharacterized protein n=1 Tax=Undibacterium terreum TaxID=1224302 RepID=A0A916XPQ1_9BURK|nr:hypothetical protein [Undibacterium terreum]GGC89231.1 hypothetical protein GCM10011396_40540 [Undibacterium terreum]